MPIAMGTRIRANNQQMFIDQGKRTQSRNTDKGMKKRVAASITFTSANGRATAAGGTFTNTFVVGDPVQIAGTALNNSFHEIVATDGSTYLQLAPPPKDEGPIVCVLRTP